MDMSGNITEAAAPAAQDAQEVQKKNKPRKTYTAQEVQEAQENLRTSGRKGAALPRINLAFTPSNYEYIKTMAAVRGENLTEFVNSIINQHAEANADIYSKAVEFKNSIQ